MKLIRGEKLKLIAFGTLLLFTFGCGNLDANDEAVLGTSAFGEIWYGDPNRPWQDVFVNFNTEDNRGTNPTLSTVQDPQYGKVWRVHKPPGAKRAEISRAKGYNQREGEKIYIGWRWKIDIANADPSDDIVIDHSSGDITVFQWKTEGGGRQNYPFIFGYDGDTLSLDTYGPGTPDWTEGPSIQLRRDTVWEKAVAEGQWVDIVLGMKVSSYDGSVLGRKGYIELWFNGEKQTFATDISSSQYKVTLSKDGKRAYHRTNDGSLTYPKWGAYNGGARPYDIYTYFDEMKIARTYAAFERNPRSRPLRR